MPLGLAYLGPELALTATAVALAIADVLWARHRGRGPRLAWLAAGGLLIAAVALLAAPATDSAVFSGMVAVDGFARFFRGLFLAAALCAVAFASQSDEVPAERQGEYLVLLCCLCLGLCLLVAAQNLLLLYLSIELVSVPSYVLAGFRRGDRRSSEAALKYVIYGGVASGLMLYGFSWMYGLSGTLDLPGIGAKVAASGHEQPATRLAIALAALFSLAGFGYKVAAVPFHMWCPDVYEGAPTPFVAFLSVGPKAAGLAALLRFVLVGFGAGAFPPAGPEFPWPVLLGVLSVATMTLGNLAAIAQNNLKRLLAYSSIAHAGYMLAAVAVATDEGKKAVMVYLGIYLFMNLGAFLAVIAVRERTGSETIDAYSGLGTASPYLAAMLSVFLFSLTGLPPLGGFIGKFGVFAALIRTEQPFFYIVALIGVLNSAVSLYYYARVVKAMYLERPQAPVVAMPLGRSYATLLTALAVPTVLLGVWWAPLAGTVERFSSLLR
jgi:NADH-quinone oxidoreductase subunit N